MLIEMKRRIITRRRLIIRIMMIIPVVMISTNHNDSNIATASDKGIDINIQNYYYHGQ